VFDALPNARASSAWSLLFLYELFGFQTVLKAKYCSFSQEPGKTERVLVGINKLDRDRTSHRGWSFNETYFFVVERVNNSQY
jgi:hypothetical protein